MKSFVESKRGITLVSLVVTIIVLLILAGTSMGLVLNDNGIIKMSRELQSKTLHSNVYGQLQMEALNYKLEKDVDDASDNLISYLQRKSIIGREIESGKWQINVVKLLGAEQKYGNGTATASERKDVYMLEIVKSATSNSEGEYKVMYYGENSSENADLGNI